MKLTFPMTSSDWELNRGLHCYMRDCSGYWIMYLSGHILWLRYLHTWLYLINLEYSRTANMCFIDKEHSKVDDCFIDYSIRFY